MRDTRIQTPVSAETREMLEIYAKASRKSLAGVCGEILEQTAPVMLDLAKAIAQAKTAPAKAMRTINETLEAQLAQIDQHSLDLEPKKTKKKA